MTQLVEIANNCKNNATQDFVVTISKNCAVKLCHFLLSILDLIQKISFQNAVGISIDNWTNQKLEFPEFTIDEGSKDRWYSPVDIHRHTRDIALLAYSLRGSGTKGSLSYLVEDSWPRTYICIGWDVKPTGVEVLLSVADKHLDFDGLVAKELNGLLMKVYHKL